MRLRSCREAHARFYKEICAEELGLGAGALAMVAAGSRRYYKCGKVP
jgi:hypothetical protein